MSDYTRESFNPAKQQYHNGAYGHTPYDPEGHRKQKSGKSLPFLIFGIVTLLLAVVVACIVLAVVLKESKDDNEYTVNVNLHLPLEYKEEYNDPDSPERQELESTLCAEAGKATEGMGMDSCKLGQVEPGSIRAELIFVFIVTIEIRQRIVQSAEDCEDCGVEATTVSFDILIVLMMPRIIMENAPEGGLVESGVVCETLSCEGAPDFPESSGSGSGSGSQPSEESSGGSNPGSQPGEESSGGSTPGPTPGPAPEEEASGEETPGFEASGEGSGDKSDNKSESTSDSETKSKSKCKSAKSKSKDKSKSKENNGKASKAKKNSKEDKDGHPVFDCEPNPGGKVHPRCKDGNDDGGNAAEDGDGENDAGEEEGNDCEEDEDEEEEEQNAEGGK